MQLQGYLLRYYQEEELLILDFKIPLDISDGNSCHVNKQSSVAKLMNDARLIIWDEVQWLENKLLKVLICC